MKIKRQYILGDFSPKLSLLERISFRLQDFLDCINSNFYICTDNAQGQIVIDPVIYPEFGLAPFRFGQVNFFLGSFACIIQAIERKFRPKLSEMYLLSVGDANFYQSVTGNNNPESN